MSKVTSKATHWIRQQGYSDEYGQMLQAYEAGYREREKEHIEIHSRQERGATRIAELEKENAELKENNQFLNILVKEKEQRGFKIQEDLLQENAMLKEQIEKMRNFENCDYQLHVIDCPIFKSGGHISCKKCPHWTLQRHQNDRNY